MFLNMKLKLYMLSVVKTEVPKQISKYYCFLNYYFSLVLDLIWCKPIKEKERQL